ncbi:GspH/FimT family pseudopilin [Methylophilus sp. VKM B-3414]|jgi:type IV fimbrial biogenesis protein FimT|uniref:GspH/FimT family pseudopilin n=1 Tax=Methylophilus sp. VKM B-3414 TaxID=3076121 RepID=UPI0028C86DFD|nr:GspH/FimT family pseudopilin [Methylophilus sp. VKM B-3414]MDT7848673.1 GspH/FimT family pseudopilin [Methylophilus sp. VKM B-3414]
MQQQGFTLIELVVTMAVLVSVSTIAIPAFQTSIGNAQVRTVAESIRNGLQQARAEAIKRNARVKMTLEQNSAWQVGCVTVTPNCPALIAQKSAIEGSSSNITVTADHNTAVFGSFGTRDAATPIALTVVNVSNTQVRSEELRALRVILTPGGNIKVCDPSVTENGDSRKC